MAMDEISISKYLCYKYGVAHVNPSVNVYLRNSIKQHLMLAKFYVNSAPFIGIKVPNFN